MGYRSESNVRELAQDMSNLLNEFSVDFAAFTLIAKVSSEYYETIKDDFPAPEYRNLDVDHVIVVYTDEWQISLRRG